MGMHVIGAGDLNGDWHADVMEVSEAGNTGDGFAFAFYGSSAGIGTTPAVVAATVSFGQERLSAGDLNGDGLSDAAVWFLSGPSGPSELEVFDGSATGIGSAPSTTTSPVVPAAMIYSAMASAGDVNKDGFEDVILGNYGTAMLYLGGPGGLSAASTQSFAKPVGDAQDQYFGDTVGGAGSGM